MRSGSDLRAGRLASALELQHAILFGRYFVGGGDRLSPRSLSRYRGLLSLYRERLLESSRDRFRRRAT